MIVHKIICFCCRIMYIIDCYSLSVVPSVIENVSVFEFLYQIDIFLNSVPFYKINSNYRIRKLIQLSEPNFTFNSTFFKSNLIK